MAVEFKWRQAELLLKDLLLTLRRGVKDANLCELCLWGILNKILDFMASGWFSKDHCGTIL
jgi:hypothetical protein